MNSLTLIVITKNEAGNIERCLASVPFAHQKVVVDSGSSDSTVEIASRVGAEVVQTVDWPGFGPQKNEICLVLASSEFKAFRLPRSSSYCGQFMRHSGWAPDYVTRLFRRDCARFSDDVVHEQLIVTGKVGTLRAKLMHESFKTVEDVLYKLNAYSTAGARKMHQAGQRASLSQAVLKGCWAFLRTYVFRLGFLDGRKGFLLAVSNAEGTYYRYVKLWLMDPDQR
jgi:glycosyltransferase involved in cell wall biosynthesis